MPLDTTESTTAAELELARETASYWIEVATMLGFSRSIGELYAQIFITATPLNADELVARTGISRSGVGQAIKTLVEIGAIRAARNVPGRKEHYELQTDLGVLVRLFVNSRVLPCLNELTRRQAALTAQARAAENPHLIARFNKVERWQTKTAPLIALVKALANTA